MTALIRPRSLLSAALSLLLALSLLAACGSGGSGDGRKAAEGGLQKRELASVRVAPVVVREMARVLETTSKLDSEREIALMPRVGGVVQSLGAEEGDVVELGAVLATLDDTDVVLAAKDAEVAQNEAQNALDTLRLAVREREARVRRTQLAYDQAQRDYERNLKLFAGEKVASALSQSALEASKLASDNADADRTDAGLAAERAKLELAAGETALQRAKITHERARVTLSYTKITAPFAGVVAQRAIKVGDSVGAGTMAFVLSDVSLLRCVFQRPQEELELFARVGSAGADGRLEIHATADAYPGRTFAGWIERVSPTIDPLSGQFRVTGRLECVQEGGRVRLLPGMLVRLRIVTERHPEALVVPKRALEREGERRYLLATERDPSEPKRASVRRVEVSEGFADGEWIEVVPRTGQRLAVGDAVIVVGGRDVSEGDTVAVDEERPLAGDAQDSGEGVAEAK